MIHPGGGKARFAEKGAAAPSGVHGSCTFNAAAGAWTFSLQKSHGNRVDATTMANGQSISDALTMTSASQSIVSALAGAND